MQQVLPGIQGLDAAEVDEGGESAFLVEGIQSSEIGQAIVGADDAGSAVQLQEDVVHKQPGGVAINLASLKGNRRRRLSSSSTSQNSILP